MELSAECMSCVYAAQFKRMENLGGEKRRADYMRRVAEIIANCPKGKTAPDLVPPLDRAFFEVFGIREDRREEKRLFNQLLLDREPQLWQAILSAKDSFRAALQFSRVGNYIDSSVLDDVNGHTLTRLLEGALDEPVDETEYANLHADLAKGKRLAFLCDNAGEIVLDKLFVQQLRQSYPHLDVTVIVRGQEVQNDATMEDAVFVGMDKVARVIGSGSGVGGTRLPELDARAYRTIQDADVILSKGQGNFETLHDCGLNIYYLFLCKCSWFTNRFGMALLKGVLVNENRIV